VCALRGLRLPVLVFVSSAYKQTAGGERREEPPACVCVRWPKKEAAPATHSVRIYTRGARVGFSFDVNANVWCVCFAQKARGERVHRALVTVMPIVAWRAPCIEIIIYDLSRRGGLLVNKLRDMSHPGRTTAAVTHSAHGARADLIATRDFSSPNNVN
jgi:hypothetical protein